MDFARLNAVAETGGFLPTKRLASLTPLTEYRITRLKRVQTQWGPKVLADLEREFTVFLPKRIMDFLDNDKEQLETMVAAAANGHLALKFIGGIENKLQFKILE